MFVGAELTSVLFVVKYLKREIAKILHPKAVVHVKIDKTTIHDDIQRQMVGFLLFYLILMILSGFVLTMIEGDGAIGFIGTMTTIGNVGPGLGAIGPMGSFCQLAPITKIIMIVNMVAGRLELIPVLVMLHPDFWHFRKRD